jgi:predicted acylesterase/phospholipase RssA
MSKSALVFSAGGAFGAYQTGVWEELAPHFTPDLIIGTSIGCLNAWMVAGGVTPAELTSIWFDESLAPPLRWRMPRNLRDGLLDTDPLEDRVKQIYHRYRPQREIGIVLISVPEARQRLFTGDQITWRHLAASCAVPVFLRQQQIGGVTYTDGGLFDSVNLWAALELGATRVLAINCWKPRQPRILEYPTGLMAHHRRRNSPPAPPAGRDASIVTIEPAGALGTMRESMFWRRDNVQRWHDLGRADALRHKHLLCDMF